MFNLAELHEAREKFAALLRERRVPEAVWQRLFSQYLCIFCYALPISISARELRSLGRPGKSEPDFVFFPGKVPRAGSGYGVIELKTAYAKILRKPRKNLVTLSSESRTAFAQAQEYLRDLEERALSELADVDLILAAPRRAFLVIGLSSELEERLHNKSLKRQFRDLLPAHIQILPYDHLFRLFEASAFERALYWFLLRRSDNSRWSIECSATRSALLPAPRGRLEANRLESRFVAERRLNLSRMTAAILCSRVYADLPMESPARQAMVFRVRQLEVADKMLERILNGYRLEDLAIRRALTRSGSEPSPNEMGGGRG